MQREGKTFVKTCAESFTSPQAKQIFGNYATRRKHQLTKEGKITDADRKAKNRWRHGNHLAGSGAEQFKKIQLLFLDFAGP